MNIREPLESIGKWPRYQEAVAAKDWPRVKSLLQEIGCTKSELKSILWSLHAPGTEIEVETTSDKIIGRGGTVLLGALILGLVFAWQASGFADLTSNHGARRRTATTDHRPWKPVVGTAFAGGAIIGGFMGAAYLRLSSKPRE